MKTFFAVFCHSRILLIGILFVSFAGALFAQTTSIKLPASDSSANFQVLNSVNTKLLRLNGDAGFYFGGAYGTGVIPATGTGTRLMWYPAKAALRAGYVNNTQWDDINIGNYSMATGHSTIASGMYSTAMGLSTVASGSNSISMGYSTTASGMYSTAMGFSTVASGDNSTAMGYSTTASGYYSTAMGSGTLSSGNYSTAMGSGTLASGNYSTAMGWNTIASMEFSTAMGSYVKVNHGGAFFLGDCSKISYDSSSAPNQMTMRFAAGYRLFTNSACTTGVTLASGGSSWGTVSDSTKKTNFKIIDGEYFLKSLSQLRLGSWNYIGQDAKHFRHYGPMAQEIFHYFGKDEYGVIGNDTTLTTADMDGIMMICLQALEKRTAELQKANEHIAQLENKLLQHKAEQEKINAMLNERIEKMSHKISSLTTNSKLLITNNQLPITKDQSTITNNNPTEDLQ